MSLAALQAQSNTDIKAKETKLCLWVSFPSIPGSREASCLFCTFSHALHVKTKSPRLSLGTGSALSQLPVCTVQGCKEKWPWEPGCSHLAGADKSRAVFALGSSSFVELNGVCSPCVMLGLEILPNTFE